MLLAAAGVNPPERLKQVEKSDSEGDVRREAFVSSVSVQVLCHTTLLEKHG